MYAIEKPCRPDPLPVEAPAVFVGGVREGVRQVVRGSGGRFEREVGIEREDKIKIGIPSISTVTSAKRLHRRRLRACGVVSYGTPNLPSADTGTPPVPPISPQLLNIKLPPLPPRDPLWGWL